MDFNKVLFIAVLGVVAIALMDVYNKYDIGKRRDELKAQEQANETMLQMQELQAEQLQGGGGLLGGLFEGLGNLVSFSPIGSLFG